MKKPSVVRKGFLVALVLIPVALMGALEVRRYLDCPVVTVTNRAEPALRTVTVYGSGFSHTSESLPAGESLTVPFRVRGESGVGLRFSVAGKAFDLGEGGYVESGRPYRVDLVVKPDLTVSRKQSGPF